ncbi:MAG: ribonuclease domain-containing protein [Arenimonas sp.]
MLKKYGWIVLLAAFAAVYWLGQPSAGQDEVATVLSSPTSSSSIQSLPTPAPLPQTSTTELPDFLPPEAKTTLNLIGHGGPFPHRQDGVVFQNREQRLPKKSRAYYREYTVETPGLNHRGARRIITGGNPVEVYYYSDDHYDSFREFEVHP